MDKASPNKKITPERLKDFFDLYIKRQDRINNWDLVDFGCLHMTGSYLFDKQRNILYKMAKSKNLWERRSAILNTTNFIRQGQSDDTFAIAEMLINDKEDLVHKATGWMLRFAVTKDKKKLLGLLDKYAATMPRVLLRYSIEHFSPKEKDHYMGMKKKKFRFSTVFYTFISRLKTVITYSSIFSPFSKMAESLYSPSFR